MEELKKLKSHLDDVIASAGDYISQSIKSFINFYILLCFTCVLAIIIGCPIITKSVPTLRDYISAIIQDRDLI